MTGSKCNFVLGQEKRVDPVTPRSESLQGPKLSIILLVLLYVHIGVMMCYHQNELLLFNTFIIFPPPRTYLYTPPHHMPHVHTCIQTNILPVTNDKKNKKSVPNSKDKPLNLFVYLLLFCYCLCILLHLCLISHLFVATMPRFINKSIF